MKEDDTLKRQRKKDKIGKKKSEASLQFHHLPCLHHLPTLPLLVFLFKTQHLVKV